MTDITIAPETLSDLQNAITERYDSFSKRLRQVAQYLMDHPSEIAFGTVTVIAKDAQVHPSTLVRFANALGYSGFTEMQSLFQQKLLQDSPSYTERIRIARETLGDPGTQSPSQLLGEFTHADTMALQALESHIPAADLDQAIDILAGADATHIIGVRRSFVPAAYFAYALRHIDRRAHLLDNVGGMIREQASTIGSNDVLLAISFRPYATETNETVRIAVERGVPIVVITDSKLSPLARLATVAFTLPDSEVHGFRSITPTLCLAQSLAIGLAYRLDKNRSMAHNPA
ncbi:MurR/RpiR family transcriptional regulator [Saccharospirillum impatiens]|uniref:MurR/RpiR family transcriptional regulator n=1 Tax=Saccharospirillum impatiens TaxID=169438 RepID=UPI00041DC8EF|nr:MurR/RpiR family transcriptional regulator [Saccharospirillum impatiens]